MLFFREIRCDFEIESIWRIYFLEKFAEHCVEKWEIYSHRIFFSSDQLFSNFFSKAVTFTKCFPKSDREISYFPVCDRI